MRSAEARALLSCSDLKIGYLGKPLLAPIDLAIERGQFWCVLGRNGAGKTTLVRTLLGLIQPLSGSCGSSVGSRLGYLPQKARFDELYPMSARDVVLMGTERGLSFFRRRAKSAVESCDQALRALDLEALAAARYRDLSEGQKQRVLLARLTAGRPALAFLDEPTTAMDQYAEEQAFSHMARLCGDHEVSLVLVTHDFALAKKYASHALFVDDSKRRVLVGSVDEILSSEVLRQRYGLPTQESGA